MKVEGDEGAVSYEAEFDVDWKPRGAAYYHVTLSTPCNSCTVTVTTSRHPFGETPPTTPETFDTIAIENILVTKQGDIDTCIAKNKKYEETHHVTSEPLEYDGTDTIFKILLSPVQTTIESCLSYSVKFEGHEDDHETIELTTVVVEDKE